MKLILILLLFQAAFSWNNTNWQYPNLKDYTNLPDSLKISDYMDTLLPGAVAIRRWPYLSGVYILAVETDSSIQVLRIDSTSTGWKTIASYTIVNDTEEYSRYYLESFDFAEYKINDSITCIGIRTAKREATSGGGSWIKKLYLLEQNSLKEILVTYIENSGFYKTSKKNSDGTTLHQALDEKGIIVISKTKKNGNYLIDKKVYTFKYYIDLKVGDKYTDSKKEKHCAGKITYYWDGNKYISNQKEIISHIED